MKPNVIEEIKNLEVQIGKRLFKEAKLLDIKKPPSPLQGKVLKYILDHKEEKICQRDLEEHLNVSKATISEVLVAMEKSELISDHELACFFNILRKMEENMIMRGEKNV